MCRGCAHPDPHHELFTRISPTAVVRRHFLPSPERLFAVGIPLLFNVRDHACGVIYTSSKRMLGFRPHT